MVAGFNFHVYDVTCWLKSSRASGDNSEWLILTCQCQKPREIPSVADWPPAYNTSPFFLEVCFCRGFPSDTLNQWTCQQKCLRGKMSLEIFQTELILIYANMYMLYSSIQMSMKLPKLNFKASVGSSNHYVWNKTFKLRCSCESFGKLVLYGCAASRHKFSEKLRKRSDSDLLNPTLDRCGARRVSETIQQAAWTGYKSTLSLLFQLWFQPSNSRTHII